MTTFHIPRKKQFLLLLEGCGGYDTASREHRIQIASTIHTLLPDPDFNAHNLDSYDLSLLLEQLSDDAHARVFETYLNRL